MITQASLKTILLAAGMTDAQTDDVIKNADNGEQPASAEQVQELIKSLKKGKVEKGELKIEHESEEEGDEDEEYDEVEAEGDDEAEEEMTRRRAAKAVTKGLAAGGVENVVGELLRANSQLLKSLRQERRAVMHEIAQIKKGLGTDVSARLAEVEKSLGEIKKGIGAADPPRGLTGAMPAKHPAEQTPEPKAAEGWTYDKLTSALRKSIGGLPHGMGDRANNLLWQVRLGHVTAQHAASELGLRLSDAA